MILVAIIWNLNVMLLLSITVHRRDVLSTEGDGSKDLAYIKDTGTIMVQAVINTPVRMDM